MDLKEQARGNVKTLGIEEYLKRSGVDEKTMKKNKNTFASVPGEKWYYYNRKTEEKNVLVPVSAIKGVNRMKNFTWFDLLNYGAVGAPQNIRDRDDFNVNSNSFWGILSWLENNSLEEVKNMYESTDRIQFYCFQKGDTKEYYLIGDGNHRVVTAKNIGVPCIIAENVDVYEYNEEEHRTYEGYKRKEEKLYEIIGELRLSLTDYNQIAFFLGARHGFLFTFTHKERDLENDFTKIDVMTREVDDMIDRLNKIKRDARKYYWIYNVVPGKMRDLIKKVIPYDIEDKGVSHMIALKEIDKRKGVA